MSIDYIAIAQAKKDYRRLMRGATSALDKARFKRLFRKARNQIIWIKENKI